MFVSSNLMIILPSIVGIVVLTVIVVCGVLILRRKKATEGHLCDAELIVRNSKSIDIIIATANRQETESVLHELQERLKYLIPSEKKDVYDADEYISNLLREFRIKLSAAPNDSSIMENYMRQINIAIASRNTLL